MLTKKGNSRPGINEILSKNYNFSINFNIFIIKIKFRNAHNYK